VYGAVSMLGRKKCSAICVEHILLREVLRVRGT
jgi:hypothetical protein